MLKAVVYLTYRLPINLLLEYIFLNSYPTTHRLNWSGSLRSHWVHCHPCPWCNVPYATIRMHSVWDLLKLSWEKTFFWATRSPEFSILPLMIQNAALWTRNFLDLSASSFVHCLIRLVKGVLKITLNSENHIRSNCRWAAWPTSPGGWCPQAFVIR